jgi:serine/threonine protein kinase/DNA-binding winged helix-turn-helix (wHTH) protein/tetratricopeptide (TPR) repeat protein
MSPSRVLIGAFELDVRAGELRQGDRTIRLQKKPCQVLLFLVESVGQVVTRDEIQKRLWPNGTVVDFEHGINAAIKKLRAAFGDSAESPRYIETLARRGYRLVAAVESIAAPEASPSDPCIEVENLSPTAIAVQPGSGPLIGRRVSHYRVLEVIGGGGMGVVCRAEDLKLGRRVALKFLPEELGGDPQALERFEREARAASALDHPNICSIHEFGEHEGQPFLVMQLLEGQTLRDRLAEAEDGDQAFALDQLLDVAVQVTQGLEAAHEKGIIHRDIKPANIFITTKGVAKILDFGVAKLTSLGEDAAEDVPRFDFPAGSSVVPGSTGDGELGNAEVASPLAIERTLTRTGIALGTAGYMSPEQIRGEKLDARTDLFTFGLVLYEMATGQRAFTGETAEVLHDAILNQAPVPVHDLNSSLPPRLQHLIAKAMQKDRGLRFQSAGAIRVELETIIGRSRHGVVRRHWKQVLGALILVAALVAGLLYRRAHRSTSLSEKDLVVLADFNNATGDAVFDGTLKQALAIQLEQSPFLNVLSDKQVNDTLKLMKHPATERLTEATAQEVCTRSNSRAVITGSIAPIRNGYGLGLKTVDCHSGDTLAIAKGTSPDRDNVLKGLGDAANNLRQTLGESLGSLQQFNTPLEEATTPSLDALQAYTQSRIKQAEQGEAAAIPFLRLAVDLDPNFALAYAALGITHFHLYEYNAATTNLQKAFDLRNRVSQRERYFIQAQYYEYVTREFHKIVETYVEWARAYPRDYIPHARLCPAYRFVGQFDQALKESQLALELSPSEAPVYELMITYIRMNRFDKAKEVYDEGRARKRDSPFMQFGRYLIGFLQGDKAAMRDMLDSARGKPFTEDVLVLTDSETQAYQGKLRDSRELSEKCVELAKEAGSPERAAMWEGWGALREAELGYPERAQRANERALALSTDLDVSAKAGLTFALSGNLRIARQIADDLDKEYPLDTAVKNLSGPMTRAAIALQQNEPRQAIEELKASLPYELGGAAICCLTPAYLRGLAYLQARDGEQAQREFEKILEHPGIVENNVTGALAHLQLGRAQAMMGDKTAARKSYLDFLALWKDADPDIPIYKQAEAEYAKIQ